MTGLVEELIADENTATDADIAVHHFTQQWLDSGGDPIELIQAMADFVNDMVFEEVAIH